MSAFVPVRRVVSHSQNSDLQTVIMWGSGVDVRCRQVERSVHLVSADNARHSAQSSDAWS